MKKWVVEDWGFELTAIEGKAGHCRLGLEKGDTFTFSYECPQGICPRVMAQVYTWCEVIRCGGRFYIQRNERQIRNVYGMPLQQYSFPTQGLSHQQR